MDTTEILNKLRGWANDPPALFLNEFEPLYTRILHKKIPACKCPDKIRDAVLELYCFIKRNNGIMEQLTKKKAVLRAGCVLYHVKGYEGIYTNTNLTDEVARAFLQQRPDKKTWFASLPDPVAEQETEQETKQEQEQEQETAPAPKKRGRKAKK